MNVRRELLQVNGNIIVVRTYICNGEDSLRCHSLESTWNPQTFQNIYIV
jgi:hypothetical protein